MLRVVFDALLRRYRERVPDYDRVVAAMREEGLIESKDEIAYDHIAFRTLGVPHLGIAWLEKIFSHFGYKRGERVDYPERRIHAYWYAEPNKNFPRIFVSELRVAELPPEIQTLIRSYTDEATADVDLDNAQAIDELLHRPLWRPPTFDDYQRLLQTSEYAAWLIANRYNVIHFTIAVRALTDLNACLERRGFAFHGAGGKTIRSNLDGSLLQSSIVPRTCEAPFANGERHAIPGPYLAFAERPLFHP